MSVCLSAWNNSATTGMILIKYCIPSIFRKYVEKIQVLLKSNNNVTLREDQSTFLVISRSALLRTVNISYKSCRENPTIYFVLNNFFPSENCAVYENVEKYCTAGQATNNNNVHCMLDN